MDSMPHDLSKFDFATHFPFWKSHLTPRNAHAREHLMDCSITVEEAIAISAAIHSRASCANFRGEDIPLNQTMMVRHGFYLRL